MVLCQDFLLYNPGPHLKILTEHEESSSNSTIGKSFPANVGSPINLVDYIGPTPGVNPTHGVTTSPDVSPTLDEELFQTPGPR